MCFNRRDGHSPEVDGARAGYRGKAEGEPREPGTDGTLPWFFLTLGPPGPSQKPCQAPLRPNNPTRVPKSSILGPPGSYLCLTKFADN